MRITLGQLRRIIKEEVTRAVREGQGELDLGWAGVSKSHRHAAAPDAPPEGFWVDPSGDGTTAYGDGEIAKWNPGKGVWDIKPNRAGGSYAGPTMGGPDHSMDQAVGGRSIGDDWRSSRYGGRY
jgi:hypothetical protein